MHILNFRENLEPGAPVVVTIGNFDGVHLGHRALIGRVVEEAQKLQCSSALVTFDPHPQEVLFPEKLVTKICTPELKVRLFEQEGLDTVHIISFTPDFSQLSPEAFALHFLIERFNLAKVVIGYDFCFGKARAGNAKVLESLGHKYGFSVETIPAVQVGEKIVSSTLLRQMLQQTEFDEIPRYLGRAYSIYGAVVTGEQRGRLLGFPTANLRPSVALPLPYGVYAVRVEALGQSFYGVTNIGVRPTFGPREATIETFLFDFSGDLYGKNIEVFPLKWLRPEQKFPHLEALTLQIQIDIAEARKFLEQKKADLSAPI